MAAAIITYELVLIQLDGKDGAAANIPLNVTKTWILTKEIFLDSCTTIYLFSAHNI